MPDEMTMPPQMGAYDPNDGSIALSDRESKKLLAELNTRYEAAIKDSRRNWKRWDIIKQYLQGKQFAGKNDWATIERRLNNMPFDSLPNVDDEKFVDNLMLRIHMSNMHRLTRFQPQIEITPNSRTVEDKNACRLGRLALYDLHDRVKFREQTKKAARIICTHGHVYLKCWFDPEKGEQLHMPVLGDRGEVVGYSEQGEAPGEVAWAIVSPKNITLPAYSVDMETLDWIQESNIRTVDYVMRKYKVNVKGQSIYSKDMDRFRKDYTLEQGQNYTQGDTPSNYVLVHECFIERNAQFPQGAIVTYTNDKILYSKSLYDFYPGLPYAKAEFIYEDESIQGDTPYWHMIPYQDALNEAEADVRRHVVMMTQPKYLRHTESQVREDQLDNRTGGIVDWQGEAHHKPEILQMPALPTTVNEWISNVEQKLTVMSAAQDVVRSTTEQSGNAIAYKQQQDDSTLAPVIESLERMFEWGDKTSLQLMSQHYDIPRLMKMTDGKKTTVEEAFKGEMLRNNFDVHLSLTNGMPYNQLAKQQYIFQALDKKVIDPMEARAYLEFGQSDEMLKEMQIKDEVAEKIVADLENGIQVLAHEWDDHESIIRQLKMAMWERFKDWSPPIQQAFEQTLQIHQQALAVMAHPGNAAGGPLPMAMHKQPLPPAPMAGQASGQEAPEAGGSPSAQEAGQQPERAMLPPISAGAPQNV